MKAALVIALVLALPSAAAADNGKRLFGRYCATCHGATGQGTAIAPDLRGVGRQGADFYLRTGYMPLPHAGMQPRRSRPLLGPQQVDALVAYVASLGPGPAVPHPHPERGSLSQGQQLFVEHCAGCHQVAAQGGYTEGALPPPLGDATPTQVAEAVRIGPYVMPAFSKKAISDGELDSIVRYVEWTKRPNGSGGWALGRIGPVPEGLVTWFFAMTALVLMCMVLGKRLRRG